MSVFKKFLVAVLVSTFALSAVAADKDELHAKLERLMGWKVNAIADAPIEGLYQLDTERGIFYATTDGQYLMQARIYNMDEGMRDETEAALSGVRIDGLKRFTDDVIEFKAKKEKYVVTIFTDVSCGYCRKLHEQMGEYNEKGITVRYLAFPRAGVNSSSYNDMVSVWCATDPHEAMTQAKLGQSISQAKCANSVAEQYQFGQQIGVNGTPNIILPNGGVVPGYQPAELLLQALQASS